MKKLSETRRVELKLEPGEKVTWAGDLPLPVAEAMGELVDRLVEAEERVKELESQRGVAEGRALVERKSAEHKADVARDLAEGIDKLMDERDAQGRVLQVLRESRRRWVVFAREQMKARDDLEARVKELDAATITMQAEIDEARGDLEAAGARDREAEAMADMIRVVEREPEAIGHLLHVEGWLEARRRRDSAIADRRRIEKEGERDG